MPAAVPGLYEVTRGQLWRHRGTRSRWLVVSVDRDRDRAVVAPSPADDAKPWLSELVRCERLRRDYELVGAG